MFCTVVYSIITLKCKMKIDEIQSESRKKCKVKVDEMQSESRLNVKWK